MDTQKQYTKPLILDLDETQQDFIEVVNKALNIRKIPCYLLEPIVFKIYSQINEGFKQELALAKAQMIQQNQVTINNESNNAK